MPAATSAPKATTRMIRVSGTENSPAFLRSSKKPASTAFPVLVPNDPMKKSGFAFWSSSTRSTTGSILSGSVVRVPSDLEPHERRMLVARDLARVFFVERRLHLRDRVERSDSRDDRLHGLLERRVGGRQRPMLNEDGLARGLPEVLVQDLVHSARLPRPGGLEHDQLHRGDDADREQGDRERKPAEDRLLAVMSAPARHAGGDVRPLARWPLPRGLGLVLDDPCLHRVSLAFGCRPASHPRVVWRRRETCRSTAGFLVSSGAQVEQHGEDPARLAAR